MKVHRDNSLCSHLKRKPSLFYNAVTKIKLYLIEHLSDWVLAQVQLLFTVNIKMLSFIIDAFKMECEKFWKTNTREEMSKHSTSLYFIKRQN